MSRENRFRLSAAARNQYRIPESRWRVSLTSSSGSHPSDKHFAIAKWRNLLAKTSYRQSFQSETRKTSRLKIGTRVSWGECIISRRKTNCSKKFDTLQKNESLAQISYAAFCMKK